MYAFHRSIHGRSEKMNEAQFPRYILTLVLFIFTPLFWYTYVLTKQKTVLIMSISFSLVTAGALSNATVILANDGFMPVYCNESVPCEKSVSESSIHALSTNDTSFMYLGDILHYAILDSTYRHASIGDLLLGIGIWSGLIWIAVFSLNKFFLCFKKRRMPERNQKDG